MQIFVKNIDGQTFTIDVDHNTLISELKYKIAMKTGIPEHIQRLIYSSKELNNKRTITDHNIISESTIHIVFRLLSGGMVFVKYKNKIIPVPIKLDGIKILSSSIDIIDYLHTRKIYSNNYKDINIAYNIVNKGDIILDKFTSLYRYGILSSSSPQKMYYLKLLVN